MSETPSEVQLDDEPALPTTDSWKDKDLTAERVREALVYVTYRDNELVGIEPGAPVPGSVIVDGLVNSYCLHPARLEEVRETYHTWIDQLAEPFSNLDDGGWSFLQLPINRAGEQWAEHMACEQLIILGIGLGCCQYVVGRDEWARLPHAAPYLMFSKEPDALKAYPMTIADYAKMYSDDTSGNVAN